MKKTFNIQITFEADARDDEQFYKYLKYSLTEVGAQFMCRTTILSIEEVNSDETN